MRLKKPTETDLVYTCLDYLKMRGIPAWRQNTGLACGADGRQVRFGFPGIPDIIGWLPATRRETISSTITDLRGQLLAVECKLGNRQLTPEQAAFLDRLNDDGGCGLVVREIDELVARIESLLG